MLSIPKFTLPLHFVYENTSVTCLNVDGRVLVPAMHLLFFAQHGRFLVGISIMGESTRRIWGMRSVLWCYWLDMDITAMFADLQEWLYFGLFSRQTFR